MKRNIIAIGLIFAMLMSFAACKKLPQDNEFVVESQVYVVDDEGVTHNVNSEFNEKGEEIFYYEDHQGNKVIVKDKDVVVETTKVRKTSAVYEGIELTPEEQSFLDIYNNPDAFENLVDESIVLPEMEIPNAIPEDNFQEIEVEVDSDGNPMHDDIEKRYTDIIDSGKYTMDVVFKTKTADGVETTMPVYVVRNGDKMYSEIAMPVSGEGLMKAAFLVRDEKYYLIIPGMRAYMTVSSEEVGDIFAFDTDMIESDLNATYVSTNEVKYNGKKYIVDVYESEGSTTKYYYTDNEFKRMEATDPDGNITIIEVNEISNKVDSSKLKVPSGYIDMTKFMNQNFSSVPGVVPTTKS